jgi:hypothetical protein
MGDAPVSPTAAQFINGRFISDATPSGVHAFNIPAAADIISALPNGSAGDTFYVFISNGLSSQARTLSAGGGITITGVTTIAAGAFARLVCMVRGAGAVSVLR